MAMATDTVQFRIGSLEADMENVKSDIVNIDKTIEKVSTIQSTTAVQIATLTSFMNTQIIKKHELSAWEMILVAGIFSVMSGTIVGIITLIVR